MQTGWMLAAAVVVAGHVVTQPAAAVPLAPASTAPAPSRPDVVLVQSGESAMLSRRMQRLHQHRAIIEDALAPRYALPPEPLEPQTQPLQPPAAEPPPEPEWSGEAAGLVDCDAAAAIVADYGFSDIQPRNCSGELYTFSAMRDGTAYALSVTPDGEIADVSRQ